MAITITANTTRIATITSVLLFWLAVSDAAEVAKDISLIEVIWLVEFTDIRDRVVVELVVICSVVAVVVGVYGTTTTLNSWWAEAITAPFIEAIR